MPLLPIIFAASLFSFFMSKKPDSASVAPATNAAMVQPAENYNTVLQDSPTNDTVLREDFSPMTSDSAVLSENSGSMESPAVAETAVSLEQSAAAAITDASAAVQADTEINLPVLGFHPEGVVASDGNSQRAESSPADAFNEFEGTEEVTAEVATPTATSVAPVADTTANQTIYYCAFESPYSFGRYSKPTLMASKWSAVGEVQRALNLSVDGKFGNGTKNAIMAYQREKGLEPNGCIDGALMSSLLPDQPRSDFKERASQLSYLFEGTDYDVVQFNWPGGDGTNDGQGLTWGPTGMTLASAEIVNILKLAVGQHRAILVQVLGEADTNAMAQIASMNAQAAMIHVKRTYFDPGRTSRAKLKAIFAKLGGVREVRQCFDEISRKSIDDKMRYYVNYMKEFNDITELDYAMFYDISVQTGKPVSKVKALRERVRPGSSLKGAERRRVWGQTISSMVSSAWRQNRELRNRSFYSESAMAGRYGLAERPISL